MLCVISLYPRVLSSLLIIIIGFGICLHSQPALADERYKFLRETCVPELGFFEVSASAIWNIGLHMSDDQNSEELEIKYGLYSEDRGEITCNIGVDAVVKYASTQPRASGMCGAGTHSVISVMIDGVSVAENLIFDDDCFSAGVTKISLQAQGGFISMDVAMHPRSGISGPREVFNDGFIVYLGDEVFLSSRRHPLPITMESIKQRIAELKR